jgi:hypothetical protein
MKITDGGDNIRFDGNVVMNVEKLPAAESAQEQAAPRTRAAAGKSSSPK